MSVLDNVLAVLTILSSLLLVVVIIGAAWWLMWKVRILKYVFSQSVFVPPGLSVSFPVYQRDSVSTN
jgi:hypothetical protein